MNRSVRRGGAEQDESSVQHEQEGPPLAALVVHHEQEGLPLVVREVRVRVRDSCGKTLRLG